MSAKVCRKCNVSKNLREFYKFADMADGHVNKCKVCFRADVLRNRILKHRYYAEYNRKRAQDPLRKAALAAARKKYRAARRLDRLAKELAPDLEV